MGLPRNKFLLLITLVLSSVLLVTKAADNDLKICQKCKCDRSNRTLDCSSRQLTTLFDDADWKALNSSGFDFDTVNFAGNAITNVTQLPQLPIKFLDISHNGISAFARRAFLNLELLETLDLSYNQIKSDALIPEVFEGHFDASTYEPLKKVRVLRLGNNLIHVFKQDLFEHFTALEELYLDENPFIAIDKQTEIAISDIPKLRVLDMSSLQLKKLPEHIFHASSKTLEVLNLSDNGLHHVPDALQYATNLKELTLDSNPINNIEYANIFPHMPKLEKLSLSYMSNMEVIGEGAFSGLTALKEFHAVQNIYLKEIAPEAFARPGQEIKERLEFPPIEKFIVHNNNISRLDRNLFADWEDIKVIDLRFNPWACECNNQWMLDTLIPQIINNNEPLSHDLKCVTPSQMSGKKLRDLAENHRTMRCLDKYGNHPEHDGNILIGLLLGICIGIPLTMVVMVIFRRGCFGLVRPRGAGDFSRAYYQRAGVYDDTMHHI
ncbi:leucine-rich repeat transmembrane protein FLRT3-like [Culicoides brevitarsis]|uniref:leucine-rich repeat transmembrane protein FLRT3-like n=1 Tax=Culicoides brevitarsis TaxID=469753 RepID=UPI00307B5D97